MLNFEITPWEETDAGKDFLKKLEEQKQSFAQSLKSLSTVQPNLEPLYTKIDEEKLNQPKFEHPSGSGCIVIRTVIEKPVKWEMFKPNICYNDNKGNNYSSPQPSQISES